MISLRRWTFRRLLLPRAGLLLQISSATMISLLLPSWAGLLLPSWAGLLLPRAGLLRSWRLLQTQMLWRLLQQMLLPSSILPPTDLVVN